MTGRRDKKWEREMEIVGGENSVRTMASSAQMHRKKNRKIRYIQDTV